MLQVELGYLCPGACGLFILAAEDLGELQISFFLVLDKFSTTILKAFQPWPFAD